MSDDEIRALLKKYNVRPTKKHGQSFLKSHKIAREIVDAADITNDDSVLEIGGGLGILTRILVERARHVYVVELDPGLSSALKDMFSSQENISIIEGDALSVQLPEVTKIVSNLPYSISSEITFRILQELNFEQAILMYQKEFAARLQATPGSSEYSRLSVNIQYLGIVEHILDVPANLFYPEPAVDSVVVRLKKVRHEPQARSEDVFFWMINGIFSYPNKKLRNALRIWFRNLDVDQKLVDDVLKHCKGQSRDDDKLRTIPIENLILLSDSILMFIEEGKLPRP